MEQIGTNQDRRTKSDVVHEGGKKKEHRCQFCEKSFRKSPSQLFRHIRTHTWEKLFA